jgi:hypothetical protein
MLLALVIAAGCGGASSAPDMAVGCPSDLPSACPTPEPSWGADGGVAAIVADKCVQCHRPGGVVAEKPFTDYAHVYSYRGVILSQIYSCYMPPPDASTLDPAERKLLLGWLVCGAPNN